MRKVTKKQCERTDGTKGSRIRRNERERKKGGRERERECAENGSKDRSTGESGRHEGFGDTGHAEAETSERVLAISPWGKKELRFFSGEREEGGNGQREVDANKPGRK